MRKVEALLAEYAACHEHPVNKIIHLVYVPVIVFSTLGLFWSLPVPWRLHELINWATVLPAILMPYYLALSVRLTIGLIVFVVICVSILYLMEQSAGAAVVLEVSVGLFIIAWIAQFIGHRIEGKAPSFVRDIQFLLIGPAWIVYIIYRRIGLRY